MRKVWKIGSRWDDYGASGTSILDTIFIPNDMVFTSTTLCLEIMEGDLFAVADGYKILAIAEALSPAFRMDRLDPSLHSSELSSFMDPNNYGCKVRFWRLDDNLQFNYKKRGKLLAGGDELIERVNNLFQQFGGERNHDM